MAAAEKYFSGTFFPRHQSLVLRERTVSRLKELFKCVDARLEALDVKLCQEFPEISIARALKASSVADS
jgi:hypothetical protein